MTQPEITAMLAEYVNVPHHFAYANGVTVTRIDDKSSEGTLTVGETSLNPGKMVHGGALLTLADTVSACFVAANGGNCVTSNANMEFLRPAHGPTLTCIATPKKMGHALCIMAIVITDIHEKIIATGTYTFFLVQES